MSTYYTYLIGWSKLNTWYYGSKWGKDADPSKFWISYFTSSRKVKEFRKKHGEPDVIQVRRTFDDKEKVRLWEHKVLRRIKAVEKKNWLNQTDAISIPAMPGKLNPNYGKIGALRGKTFSEAHRRKMSENHRTKRGYVSPTKGKKLSEECKEKIRQKATGRGHSLETREKMRQIKLEYYAHKRCLV